MIRETAETDVFAIPDFWKTSRCLDQQATIPTCCFGPTSDEELDQACSTDGLEGEVESEIDVWMDSASPSLGLATFRTWQAFYNGSPVPCRPSFLSEAGSGAYDALLHWPTDPLDLQNIDTPVVETRPYFSSLLALSLGRESVFFSKEPEKGTFKRTISTCRVPGYTWQVLQGVEALAMECGSTYSALGAFSQSLYASTSRCAVALASSIQRILEAVEYRVIVDGCRPQSLLQLQSCVQQASAVLQPLRDLQARTPRNSSDQEILSVVFQEAATREWSDKSIQDILYEMLRRVSNPWIESVEEWLGIRPEVGMPFTKASLGAVKGFVKVDVEVLTDDLGRRCEDVDFRLDADKVPQFLPMDIARSIFETGRNLRFIAEFHPQHPLSQPELIMAQRPPKAGWVFDWASVSHLERHIQQYQSNLLQKMQQSRLDSSNNFCQSGDPQVGQTTGFALELFGLDEEVLEQRLLESMTRLNQPLKERCNTDSLGRLVRESSSRDEDGDLGVADDKPHWSLVPILSFGGIVSAQARIVNRESLRLLFAAHGIQQHLRLQRDFQLLGNGLFCSRLSQALFDTDLETAERRAGVALQGGVMGLRLGGRATWPPASSELRLALMGVLSESYEGDGRLEMPKTRGSWGYEVPSAAPLPGNLSFAVRDMSEEEIDKCMDPDALEALDFLRLSYTTPPELACIITPVHLMHYDRIFKFLLRILRMVYTVNQSYRDINSRHRTSWFGENAALRFVRESQHFVSSVASYFLDSGVAIAWQAFEQRLDKMRVELDDADACVPKAVYRPSQVRDMHSRVLERIMHALFLRKRQQPVIRLLEEIFAMVLSYAKRLRLQALGMANEEAGDDAETAALYAQFKRKLQIFITVCRGLSEKGRAGNQTLAEGTISDEAGIGDDGLIAQLLTKLDMGDYYCRH
ncbi:hypothetical protein UVI_02036550 [Ustilaginoidea virens]|uniref:Spindle pole body component n=1 Tax=Ustilaginoidea virens TaxID=1159556 RepID=A0A063C6F7_USTVR|nr:hypothetical protein UVI_02036550 [Ustilaginoidea virens]